VRDPIGNPDTKAFEDLLKQRGKSHYSLRLYITGMTPRSTDAIAAIKHICEEFLPGRYDLEVIDIYQHPEQARAAQIIASPTLLKRLPVPLRRLIGDLSNRERVLIGLDLAET
jgi:circadian clock protein KaiB